MKERRRRLNAWLKETNERITAATTTSVIINIWKHSRNEAITRNYFFVFISFFFSVSYCNKDILVLLQQQQRKPCLTATTTSILITCISIFLYHVCFNVTNIFSHFFYFNTISWNSQWTLTKSTSVLTLDLKFSL